MPLHDWSPATAPFCRQINQTTLNFFHLGNWNRTYDSGHSPSQRRIRSVPLFVAKCHSLVDCVVCMPVHLRHAPQFVRVAIGRRNQRKAIKPFADRARRFRHLRRAMAPLAVDVPQISEDAGSPIIYLRRRGHAHRVSTIPRRLQMAAFRANCRNPKLFRVRHNFAFSHIRTEAMSGRPARDSNIASADS